MYHVAEKEEAFINGECDGGDMIHFEEEPQVTCGKKSTLRKRSRQSSVTFTDDQSTDEWVSAEGPTLKRVRLLEQHLKSPVSSKTALAQQTSDLTISQDVPETADVKPYAMQIDGVETAASSGLFTRSPDVDRKPTSFELTDAHHGDHGMDFHAASSQGNVQFPIEAQDASMRHSSFDQGLALNSPLNSITSSFGPMSTDDTYCDPYQVQNASNTFPGMPGFALPHLQPTQNVVQVHQVANVPEPQFDTTPNKPAFSPTQNWQFPPAGQNFTDPPYGGLPDVRRVPSAHNYHVDEQQPVGQQGPEFMAPFHQAPITSQQAPDPSRQAPAPFHQAFHQASAFVTNQQFHPTPSMTPTQPAGHGFHAAPERGYTGGLPFHYNGERMPPYNNDQPPPSVNHQQRPDSNFPASPLPGSVIRGFTGYGSGNGGGAWV
ncbi:hypothetical protein LTR37_005562 [Vermiconidia calcicola]|uniref:Uncharacterized protein n=1 Tax=Vermiconidia calcicola TaxID=1690605 RepID=A0ACC3NIX7_9PEZI|nr:hypothetical protein LTR37_005562 [Vermiconidia calcicola]